MGLAIYTGNLSVRVASDMMLVTASGWNGTCPNLGSVPSSATLISPAFVVRESILFLGLMFCSMDGLQNRSILDPLSMIIWSRRAWALSGCAAKLYPSAQKKLNMFQLNAFLNCSPGVWLLVTDSVAVFVTALATVPEALSTSLISENHVKCAIKLLGGSGRQSLGRPVIKWVGNGRQKWHLIEVHNVKCHQ